MHNWYADETNGSCAKPWVNHYLKISWIYDALKDTHSTHITSRITSQSVLKTYQSQRIDVFGILRRLKNQFAFDPTDNRPFFDTAPIA